MGWTAKAMEWKAVMQEYVGCGQTRKEFCAQRNVSVTAFDYWRKRLRELDRTNAERGVVQVARLGVAESAITVRVNGALVVELDGQASEEQLARVLRAAGRM